MDDPFAPAAARAVTKTDEPPRRLNASVLLKQVRGDHNYPVPGQMLHVRLPMAEAPKMAYSRRRAWIKLAVINDLVNGVFANTLRAGHEKVFPLPPLPR